MAAPAHRPGPEVVEVEYQGEVRPATERQAKRLGNSGGVSVPVDWIGKRVLCILLE